MPRYEFWIVDDEGNPTDELVGPIFMEYQELLRREDENNILTLDDGRKATLNYQTLAQGAKHNSQWSRGLVAQSMGVPARSLDEARERMDRIAGKGIHWKPVQGRKDGMYAPVFTTRKQRARAIKATGEEGGARLHDHDGGYGDGG